MSGVFLAASSVSSFKNETELKSLPTFFIQPYYYRFVVLSATRRSLAQADGRRKPLQFNNFSADKLAGMGF